MHRDDGSVATPQSARQCLGLGELLGGAQAESTEIVSAGAGNPKASVARIKVAGRFPACETVSLLSEGRTRTHVGRRASDKKSFTAADLEEETGDDDDDDEKDEKDEKDENEDDENGDGEEKIKRGRGETAGNGGEEKEEIGAGEGRGEGRIRRRPRARQT